MIMQCPSTQTMRNIMFDELCNAHGGQCQNVLKAGNDIFLTLMGRQPNDVPAEVMIEFWLLAAKHIAAMYRGRMKKGIA